MKKIFISILIFIFFTNLYADTDEFFNMFTSSTSLTSELTGMVGNNKLEPVEVLTSKDIKLLGVENIPDLLRYISGVNVYKVNHSSIDFSLRGLPGFFRIQPLILIDGMEYSQNLYDKVLFYNFPVNIDDIDRVEIIKDPTKFINGIESPGGVINIVTKRPELLNANYINSYIGSYDLLNSNFSINRFYKKTYYKITGNFRKINKEHSKKRAATRKFLTLSTTNFFENSKLFTRWTFYNGDYSLKDFYRISLNNNLTGVTVDYNFKNEKLFNFIIDYTAKNFNINFYTQTITGKIGINEMNNFYTDYYKLTLKKFYQIKSFDFTAGLIGSFANSYIAHQGKGKRESLILYLNTDFNFTKNFKLSYFLKNERARNLGNEFTYKTSITYCNDKNNFFVKLGYSKNLRNPSLLSMYYNLNEKYEYMGIDVTTTIHANKNIKPSKFYSTFFNISKSFYNLTLKGEFFYNRITNLYLTYGSVSLFPPSINLFLKNKFTFTIHGFDTKLNYQFDKHWKISTSYYIQHFHNKTTNLQGNWLVPKYKFMSLLFFNYKFLSGNIKWTYTPRIYTKCAGESDYLSILDISLLKAFYNKKFETSLNIQNLFGENGKEATYGEKVGRSVIFKLRYNF